MALRSQTGFFGKLPCNGDFMMKRLPRQMIECWDEWIRSSLAFSQEELGEQEWLDRYYVAPIWRFYWSSGICGEETWLGVFMPSQDSGGRNFPMMLATSLKPRIAFTDVFDAAIPWFESLEQILLSSLEEDIDMEDFDQLVAQNSITLEPTLGSADRRWRFDLEAESPKPAIELPWHELAQNGAIFSVWWALQDEGSFRGVAYPGLPAAEHFLDFLPMDESEGVQPEGASQSEFGQQMKDEQLDDKSGGD